MSQLSQRVPERTLLLVPGHFFYGHRFAVPVEMPPSEVPAFIELALEGVSPFPLEQLAWGFIHEPTEGQAYAYATSLGRLRQYIGEQGLESFHYALPGFIAQYGVVFRRPTVRFIAQHGAVTALLYAEGKRLPLRSVSRQTKSELPDNTQILETRDLIAKALPAEAKDATVEEGIWVGEGYTIDGHDRPVFNLRHITRDGPGKQITHTPELNPTALWNADLRDRQFQNKERRERSISQGLWLGLKGIAAAAVLLVLLQITLWGMLGWLSSRQSTINAQAPAVQRVEESDLLALQLTEAAEQSLRPIRMLEVVNADRPPQIFFTRTQSLEYNQLSIQGQSTQGIPLVNTYEQALRRVEGVVRVEQSARTQGGRTTFDMTVTFSDDLLNSPSPVQYTEEIAEPIEPTGEAVES